MILALRQCMVRRHIVWLLLFGLLSTAATPARVAIVGLQDGVSDLATRDVAAALHKSLSRHARMYLVPQQHLQDIFARAEVIPPPPAVIAVKRAVRRAKTAFLNFQNAKAHEELKTVRAAFATTPEWMAAHGALLREAITTEALMAHSRGHHQEVGRHVEELVTLFPHVAPPQGRVPPSLYRVWKTRRATRSAQPGGTLVVKTKPAIVRVLLNGEMLGVTPLERALPAGRYQMALQAEHYRRVVKTIMITDGRPTQIDTRMTWRPRRNASSDHLARGLHMADQLDTDHLLLVNVNKGARENAVRVDLIDRAQRTAIAPLTIDLGQGADAIHEAMAEMAQRVTHTIAPPSRRVPPWVWAVVGVVAAGGLVGGLVAASGGASSPAMVGSLVVGFQ
jgi:hypothetical protein